MSQLKNELAFNYFYASITGINVMEAIKQLI